MNFPHPPPGGVRPPALATLLIRACLPREDREGVLGDLAEALQNRTLESGPSRAILWYWRQALLFPVGLIAEGIRRLPRALPTGLAHEELLQGRRILRKAPVFSATVIVILALGIGANLAMFETVYRAAFRPLPYPEANSLVLARVQSEKWGWGHSNGPDYFDYRDRSGSFEALAAFMPFPGHRIATGIDRPERLRETPISTNFFQTLGLTPALGRFFLEEEGYRGAADVVVISHGYWARRFGSDPDIIGGTLGLNGSPHTIVGVAPEEFRLVASADYWRPMRPDRDRADDRRYHNWYLIGRLSSGTSIDEAQSEGTAIFARLEAEFPELNLDKKIGLLPLRDFLLENHRAQLIILLAAVGMMLLIACGNAAGMFLAKAPARRAELSIRAAHGASRPRLILQLLSESLWLSGLAGLLGVALSVGLQGVIADLLQMDLVGAAPSAISLPLVGLAVGLTLATGAAAGTYPALIGSGIDFTRHLRAGTGSDRASRFRSVLVTSQIALAVVLLIGSGLLVGSLRSAASVDPGFETSNLLTAEISFPVHRYSGRSELSNAQDQLIEAVRAIPGVESVVFANNLPIRDPMNTYGFFPREDSDSRRVGWYRTVSPGFFSTLGIPLEQGRTFTHADDSSVPVVAVLSALTADRLFPDQDPVGQVVVQDLFGQLEEMEVVGVVGDVHLDGIEADLRIAVYVPFAQRPSRRARFAIRTDVEPASLTSALRTAAAGVDSDLAVTQIITMEEVVSNGLARRRQVLTALSLYGVLPLVMAAVGLYALLAFFVHERTHEIGIRLALGAKPGRLGWSVLNQGLRLGLVGVGVGCVVGFVSTRFISAFLFGVTPTDPVTFGSVALFVLALAAIATAVPARRAVSMDPLEALRGDRLSS